MMEAFSILTIPTRSLREVRPAAQGVQVTPATKRMGATLRQAAPPAEDSLYRDASLIGNCPPHMITAGPEA